MITPFGDDALLVVFGEAIDRDLNRRAHALARAIRDAAGAGASAPSAWGTPVPAYASVLVPFDARVIDSDEATARLADLVAEVEAGALGSGESEGVLADRPLSEIGVRYGGDAGPDLLAVAERTGMTPAQVVEAHASTVYDVFFLGFVPGFAYLGTVPSELVLPRRDEPRARVPAGSVAIAAQQTAIYPTETPGGWHLLGRTDAVLWDARRDPPELLSAGDRVRFVPLDRTLAEVLEVLSPGLLSTIVDAGRPWAADLGVPRGGACDPLALRVLEAMLGGERGTTAVLEMSLLGPELAVRETCIIGLAGADLGAEVIEEGRSLSPGTCTVVRAGTTLRFPEARDGCRGYLGVLGGIDVPLMLGSRSTCLVGRFGGIDGEGRPIRAGDMLRPMTAGTGSTGERPTGERATGAGWPGGVDWRWPGPAGGAVRSDGDTVVRVVAGPHVDRFPEGVLDRLTSGEWEVSVRSDRMGVRLAGEALPAVGSGDLVSLPMVWGAIQVPSGGQPIVLLADHQTVGGYPVPAVVASVDRPVIAQLQAGDRLGFELITHAEAAALRRASDASFDAHAASAARA